MAIKAKISVGWKVRLGGMAVLFLGYAGWFLMDGFVGYPRQHEIHKEFLAFEKDHAGLDEAKLSEKWDTDVADKKGYPHYKEAKKEPGSILTQKIIGFSLIPVGLFGAWSFMAALKRWVAAEDDGIRDSDGQFAPWASITKLDKKLWPKKGIAWVLYDESGITKRILLDDFKFDRTPTEQIVRAVEEKLTDAQIEGDIRETERDKRKAEKAAAEKAAKATGAGAAAASATPANPGNG